MDLKQMEYLLCIAQTGSLTAAAERLYITPQALGKALRGLEGEIGAPLFLRESRRLVPTLAGDVFLQDAAALLERYGGMQARLAAAVRQQRDNLRLAMSHGVLHAVGGRLLHRFYAIEPDVEVNVIELPDVLAEEYVYKGECDVGFSIGQPRFGEGWVWRTVSSHRVCAVVHETHPFAGRESLSVRDLAGQPVITKNRNFRIYHTLEAAAQRAGVPLQYALQSPDEILWTRLVREGAGVGIGISFLNEYVPQNGNVSIPFTEPELVWDICLCYPRTRRLGRAAARFCAMVEEEASTRR